MRSGRRGENVLLAALDDQNSQRERGQRRGRELHAVDDTTDRHDDRDHCACEDRGGERAARDQHPRLHRGRPAPLQHATLALPGDRDDEVHERRRDDPQARNPRHVVGGGLDRMALDVKRAVTE